MSNYIVTYSNIKFNPFKPIMGDIRIEDIAHSQSLMTRANGHIKHFYSVAQHSVNCCLEAKARMLSKRVQLACLLHDASESYLSDLTRPVKSQLPAYTVFEDKLQSMIYEKYGLGNLTLDEANKIQIIDDAILYYELISLKGEANGVPPEICMQHDFSQKDHKTVKNDFMSLFNELTE